MAGFSFPILNQPVHTFLPDTTASPFSLIISYLVVHGFATMMTLSYIVCYSLSNAIEIMPIEMSTSTSVSINQPFPAVLTQSSTRFQATIYAVEDVPEGGVQIHYLVHDQPQKLGELLILDATHAPRSGDELWCNGNCVAITHGLWQYEYQREGGKLVEGW
jgi:hypothetical protein